MGKQPAPTLFDLQELALKRKRLAAKHLSDDLKRKIVQAHLVDHVPLTKISLIREKHPAYLYKKGGSSFEEPPCRCGSGGIRTPGTETRTSV